MGHWGSVGDQDPRGAQGLIEYGKLELSTLLDFGASLSYATYLPCGPLVCTYEAQGSPRCQLTEKQACWQMLPGRRPGLREGCALGG